MRQIIPFVKDIVFKTNVASITSISLECEEKIGDGEISGDFIVFGDYKIHNDTTEKELFKYRLPFTAIIPDNVLLETVTLDIKDFTYDIIENDVIRVKIDFLIEGEEKEEEEVVLEKRCENEDEEKVEEIKNGNIEKSYYLDQKLDEFLNRNKTVNNVTCASSEKVEQETREEKNENDDFKISDDDIFKTDSDKIIEFEGEVEEVPIDNEIFEPKLKEEVKEEIEIKVADNLTQKKEEKIRNEEEQVFVEEQKVVEKMKEEETKEVIETDEYITYHIHIVKENETIEEILKLYETDLDNIRMYNDITNINIGDKIIIPEYLDE